MSYSKIIKVILFLFPFVALSVVKSVPQDVFIPDTKIAIEAPKGWKVEIENEVLLLSSKNESGFILVTAEPMTPNEKIDDLGVNILEDYNFSFTPYNYHRFSGEEASVYYKGELDGLYYDGFGKMILSEDGASNVLIVVFCKNKDLFQNTKIVHDISASISFPSFSVAGVLPQVAVGLRMALLKK